MPANRSKFWILSVVLLMGCWLSWSVLNWQAREAIVLYCAHDLIFAQEIIDDFTRETGIPVRVVGDTEATKSLGLVERIIREKDHPLCDVFWNNQVLGTVRLQEQHLLQEYRGPGYARIPAQFKDASGFWTGFAGRFRVWIVNTELLEATQEAIENKLREQDLSQFAIAEPLYGTTLSHFSLLWQVQGGDSVKQWYDSLVERHARFVPGNATAKSLVAEGACSLGMTDTDDFFAAVDENRPVAMLPILVDGQPICIPNSVAMIKGTKRPELAQKLVEYLLSEQVELQLARSPSRQVPLGPVPAARLPQEVQHLTQFVHGSHDCQYLAAAQQECLLWLKNRYVPE